MLKWFESYFAERKQRVKIGHTKSNLLELTVGTPQGTALSPILFLIYINDLVKIKTYGEIISYADDTVLLVAADNWAEVKIKIENDMREIVKWLNDHNLKLNVKKLILSS